MPFKASPSYCVTVGTIYVMTFLSLVRGGNLSSLVLCGVVVAAATSSKRFTDEKTSCGVSYENNPAEALSSVNFPLRYEFRLNPPPATP